MPEVKFADAANLELADIAMVDRRRWAAACMLCNEERGACIACHFKTCNKTFHIACAKRANLPLLLEEGKSGKIHANLYCAEHRNSPADPTGAQKPELIPFYVEQYKQLPRQYSDYRGAALRSRAMGIVDRCECHFAPMPVVPTAAPASRKPAGKGTVSAVKPLMANNLTSAQEQSSVEIRGIEQQCGTIGALKHAFGIMDDMEIG